MMPVRRNGVCNPLSESAVPRFDFLLDRVFGENGGLESLAANRSLLPISIWEDEDHISIEIDAPGVEQSDIDLTLHQGLLTIKGERKVVDGRKYLYNSRPFGTFERTLRVPDTITAEGAVAKSRNGVLFVTLKKTADARPKKIAVQGDV